MRFEAPITHVYDPLKYAWKSHAKYLQSYGDAPKEVVLVGMNPGPFGMAQTGVPFGEISLVKDWMGIQDEVGQPDNPHPKRPISGFECTRSEVSGRRLWGWAQQEFETPGRFFERFFVTNYCPLVFMEESGKNRTPDKLPSSERGPLFLACDKSLRRVVEALKPRYVIGVGAFAEARAKEALAGIDVQIGRVLHPSPASPAANRGWSEAVMRDFDRLGIPIP